MHLETQATIVATENPSVRPGGEISVPTEFAFFGSLGAVVGIGTALLRWFLARLIRLTDEKLEALEESLSEISRQTAQQTAQIEKEIAAIRLESAARYVGREDYVRSQSVNEAKLDAVHRRLDEMLALIARRE